MNRRNFAGQALALAAAALPAGSPAYAHNTGVIRTRSNYGMQETIDRITKDVAMHIIQPVG